MAFFMNNNPIGIFDSGVGGLSVWRILVKSLPEESFVYYADSANCPYGPRSANEISGFTESITRFLIDRKCKIVVVACNTATAASIDHLRKTFSIPFIGMEPAVKPAAIGTKSNTIGILATEGTINGRLFQETTKTFASDKKVVVKIGKGLVSLVENGLHESEEARVLVKQYIQPMLDEGADHIVLGCTHYPFLIKHIQELCGPDVRILDPAYAIARQTGYILNHNGLSCILGNKPFYEFYSNGPSPILRTMVREITGNDENVVELK